MRVKKKEGKELAALIGSHMQQNLHGRGEMEGPGGSITRLPICKRHGGGGHRFG